MADLHDLTAEQVATMLSNHFLQQGLYDGLTTTLNEGVRPAAAGRDAIPAAAFSGFHGLSVRAVGFSDHPQKLETFIYVTRAPGKALKQLPLKIGRVQIQLERVGPPQVRPEAAGSSTNGGKSFRTKSGLVACGSSVAPATEPIAGTMGALVRDKDGRLLILSNNHVLGGCNHLERGSPISSPSPIDARANGHTLLQIATLDHLLELRSGAQAHVPAQRSDVALALADPKLVSSMQGDRYDTPAKVGAPRAGMIVQKVGRTTGHTQGIVEAQIVNHMAVPYKSNHFSALVLFRDVWVIRPKSDEPFALQGDSGALVVDEKASEAVGLFFACTSDGKRGYMTGLPRVFQDLGPGYKLVSGVQ